jgi:hypothetical protein
MEWKRSWLHFWSGLKDGRVAGLKGGAYGKGSGHVDPGMFELWKVSPMAGVPFPGVGGSIVNISKGKLA